MDSSNADVAAALTLASTAQHNHLLKIFSSLGLALLYYDFVLTIPSEVERFWKGPLSYPSFFFFVNRYLAVFSHIPIIYEHFFVMPESRCRNLQLYENAVACITQGSVAVLMILRIYALHIRDRRILYLLATILAIAAGISLWEIITICAAGAPDFDEIMYTGCDLTITEKQGIHTALAWSAILVFDAVGFVLTLTQVVRMGGVKKKKKSLFYLMLRDGTVYFGILAILYLSNILTLAFAQPENKILLTTLTNVLSTILITRMMLNIRDPKLYEVLHYCGAKDTLHAYCFHDMPLNP